MTATALERLLAEEWPTGLFGGPRPATPAERCTPHDQTANYNALAAVVGAQRRPRTPRPKPKPRTPRGICSWCYEERALNGDGTIRAHRFPTHGNPGPCQGGGQPPTQAAAA
ncbi:hypothetical protein OG594_08770 [Streptomyces sp. NBC_01214]|uniref:hypothetical protein n=1 Tax=Streptomyces sp. NBC_01214 TaxID=2903777 RepID=UPI00225B2C3E|nr:hypothetical protein [Streptomyces sp. NBC_01214]MCX4801742.1 hypothetical protein [Streptomyces sp. NBC_01214]